MSLSFDLDVSELSESPDFNLADLTLYGIDHSGPSYLIHVYFKPEDLGGGSPLSRAGSVAIFGHGGCAGDEGHCHPVGPVTVFDRRPAHQLVRVAKNFTCTEALRRALTDGDLLRVRLEATARQSPLTREDIDADALLTITEVAIHTYV